MNIRKTIAGITAGFLAATVMTFNVSAVSNQDEIKLIYDLKSYQKVETSAKAVVTITYANATQALAYVVTPEVANKLKNEENTLLSWNVTNSMGKYGVNAYTHLIAEEITVKGVRNGQDTAAPATDTFKFAQDEKIVNADPTYKYDENVVRNDYSDNVTFEMPLTTKKEGFVVNSIDMKKYDLETLGYSDSGYGFSYIQVKLTYDSVPVRVNDNITDYWNADLTVNPDVIGYETIYDYLGITPYGDKDITNSYLNSNIELTAVGLEQLATSVSASVKEAGSVDWAVYPLKSSLYNPADVIAALEANKGGSLYTQPLAVLNDVIANNENVTFTFTSYDSYVATKNSHLFQQWVTEGRAYGYQTSCYDWYAPTFEQHLYAAGTYNNGVQTSDNRGFSLVGSTYYDNFGSYSSAWGYNLLEGALVINSGVTMQLSETDKFNWGANTISFDWYSLVNEGKVTNAKSFLTSMLLYTSNDWYWDSLTVTVGDEGYEDVDCGAGLETYDDIIAEDDEAVETEVTTVEDAENVEEPIVEAEIIIVDDNPKTGNSTAAYAMIPIALAATAIILKKSK